MEYSCLLVDLNSEGLAGTWQDATAAADFACAVRYAASKEEAVQQLASGEILIMAVFAKQNSAELSSVLQGFQTHVGCIGEFQAVVCDDPEPKFIAAVFEFGVEQFVAAATWAEELAGVVRRALQLMSDPESAEAKTVNLCRSIRSADQGAIQRAEAAIGDLADYDYRAAFAKGKAYEATGEYGKAADVFASAAGMNKMFRPSATCQGEALLVTGRIDEALAVFQKLEKTNPYNVERKANMAAAFVEKGEFEKAQMYVDAAAKLAPNSSKVLEAQAQVLLCTGKIGDAFKLLDGMSDVGPFFAAKLNELGIQLSQSGKGKSALALYQKAHRIVRPELRYKISMNAALACRRLQAWDMALKFLTRCEQEYGSAFPKLQKIRESIAAARAQVAGAAPTPASKVDKAG